MKKLLLLFLSFTVLTFSSPYPHYNYLKKDGKVYIQTSMIGYDPVLVEAKDADFQTFTGGAVYGKDKNHVYFLGKVMEKADPATFVSLKDFVFDGFLGCFAKDKNFVYYQNQIIPEADPLTFVVPEDKTYFYTYGKDKNFVFSGTRKVPNIDPDGFEVIDRNYTRNKKFLYWNEELVKDADPATFEEIYYDGRYSYAKDKNYVFYERKAI